jgi:hypothetical protein
MPAFFRFGDYQVEALRKPVFRSPRALSNEIPARTEIGQKLLDIHRAIISLMAACGTNRPSEFGRPHTAQDPKPYKL